MPETVMPPQRFRSTFVWRKRIPTLNPLKMILIGALLVGCSLAKSVEIFESEHDVTKTSIEATKSASQHEWTVIDAMVADGRFTIFLSLLEEANLKDTLNEKGPFTIFAPADDYFLSLPEGILERFQQDSDLLAEILPYQIGIGLLKYLSWVGCDRVTSIQSLAGEYMEIFGPPNVEIFRVVNTQPSTQFTIRANNGEVFPMKALILPDRVEPSWLKPVVDILTARGAGEDLKISRVSNALYRLGNTSYENYWEHQASMCPSYGALFKILSGNGPFTIFIPTDNAFERLEEEFDTVLTDYVTLTALMNYHVIEGTVIEVHQTISDTVLTLLGQTIEINNQNGKLQINDIPIHIVEKFSATNGVIYIIDEILTPSELDISTFPPNIYGAAEQSNQLNTLISAWDSRDMAFMLERWGPFTVFAPTDDAFAALPDKTFESLMNDWSELSALLHYHIIDSKLSYDNLTLLREIGSIRHNTISIATRGEDLFFGDAQIIGSIQAANGVIYLVDKVQLPD